MTHIIAMLSGLFYIIALWLVTQSLLIRKKIVNSPLEAFLVEALGDIATVITMNLAMDEKGANPYHFPFEVLEAMTFAAYTARNSSVVETDLHTSGQRLTGQLMVEFNNELSRRAYGLLRAKAFLHRGLLWWVWRKFVQSYHYNFCREWTLLEHGSTIRTSADDAGKALN